METILVQQAQVQVSAASIITALGLPAGSVIGGASYDTTAEQLTIIANAETTVSGTPETTLIATWEQGQFVFSQANALLALGLPSTAVISQATWDVLHQVMTVLTSEPISQTGTP